MMRNENCVFSPAAAHHCVTFLPRILSHVQYHFGVVVCGGPDLTHVARATETTAYLLLLLRNIRSSYVPVSVCGVELCS